MLWNLSSKRIQWIRVQQFGLECLELQCGIYWLLNHFFIEFFEKPRLKIILELGAFLVLFESPHQVRFNKVDFVILRPKMWTILLNFWWVRIVVGNSNKLQKRVWKENSIECIQTWVNDIGYISV
jgi:hypothetical protein